MSETKQFLVVCGYFVGTSKWQNLDTYEPDECGYSGMRTLEVDPRSGLPEYCLTCPECEASLSYEDGHLEEVSDV